ncbi:GGDEF domain-containing protein [Roseibium sp.]|uniref:GGDEF domain-containing protein n=1 Tax=Roseibium sp. TaxID=1936156 RepID=UPI003A984894
MEMIVSVPGALACLAFVVTLFLVVTARRLVKGSASTPMAFWATTFWAPVLGLLVIALTHRLRGWLDPSWDGFALFGTHIRGDEPGYMLVLAGFAALWAGTRVFFGQRVNWWLVVVVLPLVLPLQAVFGSTSYGAALVREIYLTLGGALFLHLAVIELENARGREPLESLDDAILVAKSMSFLLVAVVPLCMWQPLALRPMADAPLWLFAWVALVLVHLVAGALVIVQLARERAERAHDSLLNVDPLTGLRTRKAFTDIVEGDLLREDHFCGAFLVLEIDDFRRLADAHGRRNGDAVLVALADFLKVVAGDSMVCARLSQAEFAIYIPGLAGPPVELLAQQLCLGACLLKPQVDGRELPFSLSIGFTDTQVSKPDVDPLLADADCALYEAQRRGGNGSRAYVPDLRAKDIEASVTQAIRLIA